MRIEQLDLIAFGPFTGQLLEFPGEGLQIVYGPNEAGKSSALRALRDALYGIGGQSNDNFLHDYAKLRIGMALRGRGGKTLSFVRRKGNKDTFLDAVGGKPQDEAPLRALLGGIDRDTFERMFGICYEMLRAGGEEMAEFKGNVGELLFSAASGMGRVRAVAQQLKAEADLLYRPSASKPQLNGLIRKFKDARLVARDRRTPRATFQQQDQLCRDTEAELAALQESLDAHRRELERRRRYLAAFPARSERSRLLKALAELGEVPLVRPEFYTDLIKARQGLAIAESQVQTEQRELESIERARGRLSAPALLLQRGDEIGLLIERRGGHLKAMRDRPRLEGERETLLRDVRRILGELRPDLSLEQAETLRLPRKEKTALQNRAAEYSGLFAETTHAKKQVEELEKRRKETKDELERLPRPAALTSLALLIDELQEQRTLESQWAEHAARAKRLRQGLEAELAALGRWHGDLEHCRRLALPSLALIDEHETHLEQAEQRIDELKKERKRAAKELSDTERELRSLHGSEGRIPTDVDLQRARAMRDRLWELVREAWQTGSADAAALSRLAEELHEPLEDLAEAYPRSVAAADTLADRLRREAERIAKHASLLAAEEQQREKCRSLEQQQELAEAEANARREAWEAVWRPLVVEPASPRVMRDWIGKHQRLCERIGELAEAESETERLAKDLQAARARLTAELEAAGEPSLGEEEPFSHGLKRAALAVERAKQAADRRHRLTADLERLHLELETAREAEASSQEQLAAWCIRWADVVRPLGLPDDATPDQATAALGNIDDLLDKLRKANDLQERIAGIDRDADEFRREVERLCAACEIPFASEPDEAALSLKRAFDEAKQARDRLDALVEEEVARQKKLKLHLEAVRLGAAALTQLCTEAGCDSPEDLDECWRRSEELRETKRGLAEAERALTAHAAGRELAEFLAELETVDADQLAGEIESLETSVTEDDARRLELRETLGRVKSALDALDTETAALEAEADKLRLLPEIAELAADYARLRLAAFALRRAVEEFNKESQQPMLREAGEWLQRLTEGSLVGLKVDFVGDKSDAQTLFGVRPNGDLLPILAMSEGTRDQLFLALRLGYLSAVWLAGETHEPLPFIVDDVLIKFDDNRVAATLQALAEFAKRTQVIVFTHHEHLLEIAEKKLENGSWHEHRLGEPAAVPG